MVLSQKRNVVSPLVRAVLVFAAVAALVTGVTFAALNDTATLAQNNVSSETADLKVSNGGAFGDNVQGFVADNLVPGTGKTFDFYLKNSSDFDMGVKAEVPGECSTYVSGTEGIPDCNDVLLTFKDTGSGAETTWTLQQLINGPKDIPGNPLLANSQGSAPADGDEGDFQITFDLDEDDVSGSSASLDASFDLIFSGVQVNGD